MKEPRTILEWETLSIEERKTALRMFPHLEKQIPRAYKWVKRAKEMEFEMAELLISSETLQTIEVAAKNVQGAEIPCDERDPLYMRTLGYIQHDAVYWTPSKIANECENMREIITQITQSGKDTRK